ncbi:MAG TPA: hypothetical protein DCS44_00715 [Cyanobacteria bacterium UBA10660]|nr:MAG TPA: hypothetical protein CPT83_07165 [Candidatus Gastranaerophilales bacterium HUM_1]HAS93122.1 hypothetical protein [Cyanobacteria bacterium UBA10660]
MNELLDIIYYVCLNYPNKEDLSNARLNKIIYLADWRNVLRRGHQVSNINWIFNHYGPFVFDIINEVYAHENTFEVKYVPNDFGKPKQIISLRKSLNDITPSIKDKDSIDFIIEKTKDMGFNKFIQYVYSTYPVLSSQHGESLNLIKKAEEYRTNKQLD